MITIRLPKRVEDIAILAARAVIRGDRIEPVPPDWREMPRWWRTDGRSHRLARRGAISAREINAAMELLNTLIDKYWKQTT